MQDSIKNQSENINFADKNIFNCKMNILLIDTLKNKYALSIACSSLLLPEMLPYKIVNNNKSPECVQYYLNFFSCGMYTMAINVFT